MSPTDNYGLAASAVHLQHNKDQYLKPSTFVDDCQTRETTPVNSGVDGVLVDGLDYLPRLYLAFGQKCKIPGRFTFGSDPELCDVLLASTRGGQNISGRHFHITFDTQQRPVLEDVSTNGITVSYGEQARLQRRRHFRWILFHNQGAIILALRQKNRETNRLSAFRVHLPPPNVTRKKEYQDKVKNFMVGAQDVLHSFDALNLPSQQTSIAPSKILSPKPRLICIKGTELGEGMFARVFKVFDVSTGLEYAGKEFVRFNARWKEVEILRGLCHVYSGILSLSTTMN